MKDKEFMLKWLKANHACVSGYMWAAKKCSSLQDIYNKAKPEWLVWLCGQHGVMDEMTAFKFKYFAVSRINYLLQDKRSINAVEVLGRYINGEATKEEMKEAADAADAAANAADYATYAAADYAAAASAASAAYSATYAADAYSAAYSATYAAADAYAYADDDADARNEEYKAQAEWITQNAPFEKLTFEL
jgi:hypothetical protein